MFEQQFARANGTLGEVGKAHDALATLIGQVTRSLETIAGIRRSL